MKFTLSWLKDHLDTNADADAISLALNNLGLEVESVENHGATLRGFTVAEIKDAKPHPDADKLRVCQVDTGAGVVEIVCGAPNARAGIKVVLAKIGSLIPNGNFEIKKSKIRGVESNGMLCSYAELNLGGDSAGIIELPLDAPVGASIVDVLGLDDPLFDIAITPNRADANGVYGIARDLAAAGVGTLKALPTASWNAKGKSDIGIKITDSESCKQFIGCQIRGLKNGPSPEWLRKKLESVGQKSISTLVDITNYFTLALNRPLHVFDAKKLSGDIEVRRAKAGETLLALNGKEYTLNENICVVADAQKAVGIGGIIGGEETGCSLETTDVFLECAWFVPSRVAAAGRDLQILSDARYRFERGVDAGFVEEGARLAVQMILDLCGGEASELVMTRLPDALPPTREITLDAARINALGGTNFSVAEMAETLKAIGFAVNGDKVNVPSWRADVSQIADLAEEVLRVRGYHHIPSTPLPNAPMVATAVLTPLQKRIQQARRLLASRGLFEGYHWSMVSAQAAQHFGGGADALTLQNPIHPDLSVMRPSILPCLLSAWGLNARRGADALGLFEVGAVWNGTKIDEQKTVATAIRAGRATPQGVHEAARAVDAFDAKADALALLALAGLNANNVTVQAGTAPNYYHPGRSATLLLGKAVVGYVGEIHPQTLTLMEVDGPVVACEIFLENMPFAKAKGSARAALKVSEFQAVERDFAFVVNSDLPASDLLVALRKAEKNLLRDVVLFDLYEGKNLPEGKKSLALRITLQSMTKTLEEAEIETISKAMIEAAAKLGASLR